MKFELFTFLSFLFLFFFYKNIPLSFLKHTIQLLLLLINILFTTDEGRRWQIFFRLQQYCTRCWRQLYLYGNLMKRFCLYNFGFLAAFLLVPIWCGKDWNIYVQLIFSLQTERYAKDVEGKKERSKHFNILPLFAIGVKPAIMEFPEVVKMQLM